jgi:hypothetical protein
MSIRLPGQIRRRHLKNIFETGLLCAWAIIAVDTIENNTRDVLDPVEDVAVSVPDGKPAAEKRHERGD